MIVYLVCYGLIIALAACVRLFGDDSNDQTNRIVNIVTVLMHGTAAWCVYSLLRSHA